MLQFLLYCAEILAPVVESCPSGPLVYTSRDGGPVLVARPQVSFRSAVTSGAAAGPLLVARCSHFVDGRTQRWLNAGRHVVTCTAQDALFGDRAVAKCVFTVQVQGCCTSKYTSILDISSAFNGDVARIRNG